jgi:hypothetical protein
MSKTWKMSKKTEFNEEGEQVQIIQGEKSSMALKN